MVSDAAHVSFDINIVSFQTLPMDMANLYMPSHVLIRGTIMGYKNDVQVTGFYDVSG